MYLQISYHIRKSVGALQSYSLCASKKLLRSEEDPAISRAERKGEGCSLGRTSELNHPIRLLPEAADNWQWTSGADRLQDCPFPDASKIPWQTKVDPTCDRDQLTNTVCTKR
jgi:hypothetical protein